MSTIDGFQKSGQKPPMPPSMKVDTNKNRIVTLEELETAVSGSGLQGLTADTYKDVFKLAQNIDTEGASGGVSARAFDAAFMTYGIFAEIGTNGDSITEDNFESIKNAGTPPLPPEIKNLEFSDIDTDGNGEATKEEFATALLENQPRPPAPPNGEKIEE